MLNFNRFFYLYKLNYNDDDDYKIRHIQLTINELKIHHS